MASPINSMVREGLRWRSRVNRRNAFFRLVPRASEASRDRRLRTKASPRNDMGLAANAKPNAQVVQEGRSRGMKRPDDVAM